MTATIRPARQDDAPFLAWAMQEADRGHVGVGTWDFVFPGPETERLPVLEQLVRSGVGTYCHWSLFLVAETNGVPVAAVAGYVPRDTSNETLMDACTEATASQGWSRERVVQAFIGARSRDYFSVITPNDTLTVEWVATRPEFRGNGLNAALLDKLLAEARSKGFITSHVGAYIGNDPAIKAYERAGFRVWAEVRNADFEARFVAPGLVFFRQAL